MQLTTRLVLASLMWIGLMLPTCIAADSSVSAATMPQAAPQATVPQATPQAAGPQAMWQQSMAAQATAPEPIPAGQPTGSTPPQAPVGGAGPAQAPEEDDGSWNAGVFGPGCAPPPCCEICGGGSGPPPDYYIEAGTRVLARNKTDQSPIVTFMRVSGDFDTVPATADLKEGMSFRSMDQGISAGMLGTIGHYLGRDSNDRDEFIEFEYWGLNRWEGKAALTSADYVYYTSSSATIESHNLYSNFPFTVPGFNRADLQTLATNSNLNNFELNWRFSARSVPDQLVLHPNGRWRRECIPGYYFSYLFGLRVIDLNDEADFHSEGTYPDVNNMPTLNTGNYSVHTRNRLIGGQLGAELTYRHCIWNVDVHGRVGPFLNAARTESSIVIDAPTDPIEPGTLNVQSSKNRDAGAIVGEFGFGATYKFRPNFIARASYDFTWIGDVALAPEQFIFNINPQPYISTHGSMFVNGLSMSLEYTW